MDKKRRAFVRGLGQGSVAIAFLAQAGAAARALLPNVLYEPLKRFKIKRPGAYPQGTTFDPERRLFVVRRENEFRVISALCTHLGCTVQWQSENFECPCHGSRFAADGSVIAGPAPRPLPWFAVSGSPDGRLVVDSDSVVDAEYRFVAPSAKA